MKLIQVNLLLVLVSLAAAQTSVNSAEIEKLSVLRSGNEMRVEVVLTAPVQPNVIVASGPDRLVLELPNTASTTQQQHIPVNQDGLKSVRIGLNSSNPPVTRVVVDLENARPFGLATSGNTVTLTILPGASMADGRRKGAPAPAASGGSLLERLRPRHQEPLPSVAEKNSPAPVTPPPALPPLRLPEGQLKPSAGKPVTNASNGKPSAAHPNFGSLQQGTVFPNMGAPGTGYVPPGAGQVSNAGGLENGTGSAKPNAAPTTSPSAAATATVTDAQQAAAPPGTRPTQASSIPAVTSAKTLPGPTVSAPAPAAAQPVTSVITAPSNSAAGSQTPAPTSAGAAATTPKPDVTLAATGLTPIPSSPSSSGTSKLSEPPAAPTQSSKTLPPTVASAPVPKTPAPAAQQIANAVTTPNAVPAVLVPPSATSAARTSATPAQPSVTSAATASTPSPSSPSPAATSKPAQPAVSASPPTSSTLSSTAASVTATAGSPTPPATVQPESAQPPVVANSVVAASSSPVANQPVPTPAATTSLEEAIPALATRQPNEDVRMAFKVKYVAEGAAYLDGGRSSGLSEGMKLEVRETDPNSTPRPGSVQGKVVADLEVTSVAETSSVTEIKVPQRDIKPGDWAYLSLEDTQVLVAQRSLSTTRKYPTVISFTEGDPLEEEARAEVPHPPLPEVNRARGRFGFDYSGIRSHDGNGMLSSTIGLSVRTDITRINGTYWNMSGFWRGRLTSTSAGSQQTLQDLINRTYHLSLTYDNPQSHWVAGFGRLYLPWATSLDTIDGGYFGRRVVPGMTLGLFAGSTPDPTSWSYNPDRRIGGTFVNFQGGSFDNFRYTSTSGIGISTLKWKIDRPFIFFENGLYYKRYLGIYSSVQADSPAGNPAVTAPGPGVSRSFLTIRVQPIDRLELDLNHTYFRDIPTFDPALIGTGLLDKYLFQGYSAGARVEVVKQIWVYSTLGRSNRSGDSAQSLNQLYGVTFGRLPWIRVRADAHYSKFDSSFGSGTYTAISLSRNFHDNFRWEVLGGKQDYVSTVATSSNSHFVTGNIEAPLGPHYFFQGGFTWNRGGSLNYEQWLLSIGYRFDTRSRKQQ